MKFLTELKHHKSVIHKEMTSEEAGVQQDPLVLLSCVLFVFVLQILCKRNEKKLTVNDL